MGDIAEMMLMGIICEQCGQFIDMEEVGYPRLCECCANNDFGEVDDGNS